MPERFPPKSGGVSCGRTAEGPELYQSGGGLELSTPVRRTFTDPHGETAETMTDARSHSLYRVLFVCTGNTCRSPMAEGILRKLVADSGADDALVESISAGTMGMVGMPATQKAIDVSAEYGVDIHNHVSQGATRKLLYNADLVLALAADHHEYCRDLDVPPEKVYLLRAFPQHTDRLQEMSVPDPIGQDRSVYQKAFFQIDEALRQSLPEIIKRARAKTGQSGQ